MQPSASRAASVGLGLQLALQRLLWLRALRRATTARTLVCSVSSTAVTASMRISSPDCSSSHTAATALAGAPRWPRRAEPIAAWKCASCAGESGRHASTRVRSPSRARLATSSSIHSERPMRCCITLSAPLA